MSLFYRKYTDVFGGKYRYVSYLLSNSLEKLERKRETDTATMANGQYWGIRVRDVWEFFVQCTFL